MGKRNGASFGNLVSVFVSKNDTVLSFIFSYFSISSDLSMLTDTLCRLFPCDTLCY